MAHGNARAEKHKARYDRYKNQGRLAKNKEAKQLRAQKREKRFAERRESGKAYVYKKKTEPTENVLDKKDPAYLESFFKKVDNQIAAEKKAMKERERKDKKPRRKKKDGKPVQKTG